MCTHLAGRIFTSAVLSTLENIDYTKNSDVTDAVLCCGCSCRSSRLLLLLLGETDVYLFSVSLPVDRFASVYLLCLYCWRQPGTCGRGTSTNRRKNEEGRSKQHECCDENKGQVSVPAKLIRFLRMRAWDEWVVANQHNICHSVPWVINNIYLTC